MIPTSHAQTKEPHAHGPDCRHDHAPQIQAAPPPSSATHLDVDSIIAYLLANQLITSGEAVDGLRIDDRSRRNRNFRVVTSEGTGLLVKQPDFSPTDHSMVPYVRKEAAFLGALQYDPALRDVGEHAPRLAFYDAESVVLVTELIYPATSITKFHIDLGRVNFDPDGAASCARLLGSFHEAGTRAIKSDRLQFLPRELPIAYAFTDMVKTLAGQGDRSAQAYQAHMRDHPAFQEKAAQLKKDWASFDGLVHADVRWDNFLLTHGRGHRGGLNVRLIDWELVCKGDPAYDVASWMGEYLRFRWNVAQPQGLQSVAEMDAKLPFKPEAWHASAQAFWAAYRKRARVPKAESADFLRRVMAHLTHYLLVAGWEFSSAFTRAGMDSRLPPSATWALDAARECDVEPERAAREWFGFDLEASA